MDLFDSATLPPDVIEMDWRSIQTALTVILLVGMSGGLIYVFTRDRKSEAAEATFSKRHDL